MRDGSFDPLAGREAVLSISALVEDSFDSLAGREAMLLV